MDFVTNDEDSSTLRCALSEVPLLKNHLQTLFKPPLAQQPLSSEILLALYEVEYTPI